LEIIFIIILFNIPIVVEIFGISPIGMFEIVIVIVMCLITLISVETTKIVLNVFKKRKSKEI